MGIELGQLTVTQTKGDPFAPKSTLLFSINAVMVAMISFAALYAMAPRFCQRAALMVLGRRTVLVGLAVWGSLWALNCLLACLLCLSLPVVMAGKESWGDLTVAVLCWITALLGLPTSLYLTASAATPYLTSTALSTLVTSLGNACLALEDNSSLLGYMWVFTNFHILMLSVSRLWALEEASLCSFGGRRCWLALMALMFQVPLTPLHWIGSAALAWWLTFLTFPLLCLLFAFGLQGLGTAAREAECLTQAAPGALQAKQAAAALRSNHRALLPCFAPFGLRLLATMLLGNVPPGGAPYFHAAWMEEAWRWVWLLLHVPQETGNFLAALLLSGALTGAAAGARQQLQRRYQRLRRRRRALSAPKSTEGDPCQKDWDQVVHDLAGRGITLNALLHFYYDCLPEVMPHFDPARHKTADVVRGAVIPLSALSRSSMAEVLMGRKRTVPNRMVTHNWSNRFCDLIAAVLADAFEEAEFENLAYLLIHDPGQLRSWLWRSGKGDLAFWICAFSVNQHRGICAAATTDSVTGGAYWPCSCGEPKMQNDAPPLLRDGRSVPCEMNKFREMICYLSEQDLEFKQVVAVDGAFNLFTRAWCVAELAMAHDLGMSQHLKILSAGTLASHEAQLRQLRIEDMQASRQADKEEILRGIDDRAAFNAAMQRLLFEDLLPAFEHLDSEARARRGGQMLRWGRALPRVRAKALGPVADVPAALRPLADYGVEI